MDPNQETQGCCEAVAVGWTQEADGFREQSGEGQAEGPGLGAAD